VARSPCFYSGTRQAYGLQQYGSPASKNQEMSCSSRACESPLYHLQILGCHFPIYFQGFPTTSQEDHPQQSPILKAMVKPSSNINVLPSNLGLFAYGFFFRSTFRRSYEICVKDKEVSEEKPQILTGLNTNLGLFQDASKTSSLWCADGHCISATRCMSIARTSLETHATSRTE
jgi:hypothetical protein